MGILRTNTVSGIETPTPVTGSVLFDGSGDTLTVTSSDFSFGTGDFTIECWYNLTATPTNFYIFDFGSNGMRFQIYDSGSGPVVYMMTSTSTYVIAPANSYVTVGQWYHIAMTRIGTTVTGFINGISQGTQTVADNFTHTALTIGNYGGGGDYEFTGYLSNLRILKGTALYTSNFTPPTRELQPIGDTVLLCCNNSTSATAEATGKTITANGNAAASTFSPGLVRDFTYGTQFDGVTKFDTQGYFVPPSGNTQNRYTLGLDEIVTSGLVLHLDAGNPFSYPATGVGTKWTDLSGNGNTGTLVNGPTYSGANRGSIVFDGNDDYISIGSQSLVGSGTSPFSVELWFYNTKNWTSGQYTMPIRVKQDSEFFVSLYNPSGTLNLYPTFRGYNQWGIPVTQSDYVNKWVCLSVVYNGGDKNTAASFLTYVNGVQLASGTTNFGTAGGAGSNCNILGADGNSGCNAVTTFHQGNIGAYKVYNRALTPEEISQNYNALRGRYGI